MVLQQLLELSSGVLAGAMAKEDARAGYAPACLVTTASL